MQHRRGTALLLAALGLLLLLPIVAAAQPDATTIREELERTDRILERAHEQIGVSLTTRAGDFLSQALRIQREAWSAFLKGPSYYRACLDLTRKARDLARRAIETAEIEIKANESIRDLVESTRQLAEEAALEVRSNGDPQAQRLLHGGIGQLERAQDAYRAREYRKAIRLAATARDLVQRALLRARGTAGGETTHVATAIDRTDALLEEVAIALSSVEDARAEALHAEAVDLQARAREHERHGRGAMALRLTSQARQIALDALLRLSRNPDREDVERALQVVEQLLSDMGPEILGTGSEKARTFYESARERHLEAASLLARGELGTALEAARTAEGLLQRAAEAAGLR